MAVTLYTYAKLCDPSRLSEEIKAEAGITIGEERIETTSSPAETRVYMKAELSSGEEDALDALVDAHVNTPLPDNEIKTVAIETTEDADGSIIMRPKVTKSGWHFEPRCITWTTAKRGALYNRKPDGHTVDACTDIGDVVVKFYDDAGAELTQGELSDEAFQALLASDCVKTIMDFYPTYDMEVIGGYFCLLTQAAAPAYAWVTIAPDIPANFGGSVPFLQGGFPLHVYPAGQVVKLDGRGSKLLTYDAVYASNKTRITILHAVGAQITITTMYDHFKA